MATRHTLHSILILIAVLFALPAWAERRIPLDEMRDHIAGAWVGQGVGVTFADVYEFKACGKTVDGDLRPWAPERLESSLEQDDLYVEMTFLSALESYGPDVTCEQAGQAFGKTEFALWHANKYGRENIRKGIMPPMSGHPKYNKHADDIDFQIEADVLGIVCPGLPQASNDLCDVFGHIMNYGDGVYGGMWIAAMYTQAYFEHDVNRVVISALDAVPEQSRLARCIRDVVRWHAENPTDWLATWQKIEAKYQDNIDCTPQGPFNIDAVLNSAYVATALLYGGGDFAETMEIATRCGQDADCNASSACGVLGCMLGLSGISEQYKSHLPRLQDKKFSYTDYTYGSSIDACVNVAKTIIERSGGKIATEHGKQYALIPDQSPIPPLTFEQWPEESQKRVFGIK